MFVHFAGYGFIPFLDLFGDGSSIATLASLLIDWSAPFCLVVS